MDIEKILFLITGAILVIMMLKMKSISNNLFAFKKEVENLDSKLDALASDFKAHIKHHK